MIDCVDSKSCNSITYCMSNGGEKVCRLSDTKMSNDIYGEVQRCDSDECKAYDNCTSYREICPRGNKVHILKI